MTPLDVLCQGEYNRSITETNDHIWSRRIMECHNIGEYLQRKVSE